MSIVQLTEWLVYSETLQAIIDNSIICYYCHNLHYDSLHHGRRTPQTSVSQAPRVLVRDAARTLDVIRWRRFDDDQLDRRADCRRVADFTSGAVYNSSRRARLSTSSRSHRPHRDDDESRSPICDGRCEYVNVVNKCLYTKVLHAYSQYSRSKTRHSLPLSTTTSTNRHLAAMIETVERSSTSAR